MKVAHREQGHLLMPGKPRGYSAALTASICTLVDVRIERTGQFILVRDAGEGTGLLEPLGYIGQYWAGASRQLASRCGRLPRTDLGSRRQGEPWVRPQMKFREAPY